LECTLLVIAWPIEGIHYQIALQVRTGTSR